MMMKSVIATVAVAVTAACLTLFAPGASASPLAAGSAAAPVLAAGASAATPAQFYGGGYERRRVYRDDRAYGRRYGGRGYERGYGRAYGRPDRRYYGGPPRYYGDSGYRGRPGVYFGPTGQRGTGERCFLDGAGRKVCR